MLKIILARRRLLPRVWKFPQIDLPRARVRVDFPQETILPWEELEVEKVELEPLSPKALKVILYLKESSPTNSLRQALLNMELGKG